jgi:hypothetical protein
LIAPNELSGQPARVVRIHLGNFSSGKFPRFLWLFLAIPILGLILFTFGSEGIGPGMFTDARSIAVDGEGRIYVGEYTGGRIQVFDPDGKFISQWSIGDRKTILRGLTTDRKGTVYAVHGGRINRYGLRYGLQR